MILGLSAEITSPQFSAALLHYRGQLSGTGFGGFGADLSAQVRKAIKPWSQPVRPLDLKGLFVEGEAIGRYMNIEKSYGGAIKLGYSF
jgi:hypothetical protein